MKTFSYFSRGFEWDLINLLKDNWYLLAFTVKSFTELFSLVVDIRQSNISICFIILVVTRVMLIEKCDLINLLFLKFFDISLSIIDLCIHS